MSTQQVMSRIARNLWRRGETITGSDLQNGEPGGSKQAKTKSKRQIRTSDIKRNKRRRKGKAIEGETRGTWGGNRNSPRERNNNPMENHKPYR
jgi:hypothetical protein